MIKAINITPVNTSKEIEYKCSNCGEESVFCLTNECVNTDDEGNIVDGKSWNCPKCGTDLSK